MLRTVKVHASMPRYRWWREGIDRRSADERRIARRRSSHRRVCVPRACAARCTPLHMHARTLARGPSRSGTAMRDLVPLRRRSTFELGLPRSQLSPLRRRMSVEGQRECTTRRRGPPLSRGCIHRRACLTRVYPSTSRTRGQCRARPRDECSRMCDPAVS